MLAWENSSRSLALATHLSIAETDCHGLGGVTFGAAVAAAVAAGAPRAQCDLLGPLLLLLLPPLDTALE